MICPKCNQVGVENEVLGKKFWYCRTCKDEIRATPLSAMGVRILADAAVLSSKLAAGTVTYVKTPARIPPSNLPAVGDRASSVDGISGLVVGYDKGMVLVQCECGVCGMYDPPIPVDPLRLVP